MTTLLNLCLFAEKGHLKVLVWICFHWEEARVPSAHRLRSAALSVLSSSVLEKRIVFFFPQLLFS